MKPIFKTFVLIVALCSYCLVVSGCGEPKNVVDKKQQTGLTPEDRADKRDGIGGK